ncbi:hypothetical protein GCM10008106_33670 [Mongoliitalea lutea]|uniref:Uncharacterized protein n=1 Tax=Mongoliitalea lutea TaxID=849756 RepID=A0A8J3D384_9BACT|nr:hypothetical protein GCM10008106_33670 [Mongoliitalea lutea]
MGTVVRRISFGILSFEFKNPNIGFNTDNFMNVQKKSYYNSFLITLGVASNIPLLAAFLDDFVKYEENYNQSRFENNKIPSLLFYISIIKISNTFKNQKLYHQ